MQPHKVQEETKASRNQKDHLTQSPCYCSQLLVIPGSGGSQVRRAKLDGRNMRRGPSSQADQDLGVRSHCRGAEGIVDTNGGMLRVHRGSHPFITGVIYE